MTSLLYQNAAIRANCYTFSVLFSGGFAPESSFFQFGCPPRLPNHSKFVHLGGINDNLPEFSDFFLLAQKLLLNHFRDDITSPPHNNFQKVMR